VHRNIRAKRKASRIASQFCHGGWKRLKNMTEIWSAEGRFLPKFWTLPIRQRRVTAA
jgi:hypothetical protein